MAAQEIVEDIIQNNKIVVFSKSYCPACRAAKTRLTAKVTELNRKENSGLEISIIELDLRDDGSDLKDYLVKKTRLNTVPNIFINQQHIGGNDTLVTVDSQGKLDKLLAA